MLLLLLPSFRLGIFAKPARLPPPFVLVALVFPESTVLRHRHRITPDLVRLQPHLLPRPVTHPECPRLDPDPVVAPDSRVPSLPQGLRRIQPHRELHAL